MLYKLGKQTPDVSKAGYIADSAQLIGSVTMAEDSSVWFNAVIRADNAEIKIGARSNIQDGSVLHVDENVPLTIGEDVTIGHKVMLHGCTIGDGSLIGINAVVLNNAVIGKNCIIGANALVTENMQIPDNSMVLGSPAKIVKSIDEKIGKSLVAGAKHYVEKAKDYSENLQRVD